ncbi:MAG: MBOAT family protein [Tannerellaceae bacterium]|jgi:D-alanyl-lipoteichoic acid acyltransferase DltB (MBOAT superfamily)|nr:MBOAT family protein [Tannerellaceae bacterium]
MINKALDLLAYHPEEPMLFSSGLFFFLFAAFMVLYTGLRKYPLARIIYVSAFSLFFYYKSSGLCFLLLLFTATIDFCIGAGLKKFSSSAGRRWLVVLSLTCNLGMLGYFKYYNFLLDILFSLWSEIAYLWGMSGMVRETAHFDIFLPVGISFFTFQSLSYVIDIYRRRVEPVRSWIDYVFYVSFFPQLVAGPIIRARDFIPQIYKTPAVSREQFGEGLFLIICGLLKKCVISDYISLNFVDRVFDEPLLYTGVENLLGVYGYALQIYCDFSGYSDMAIGIALLLGFHFNINFDSPYQSATITEFWRRWHISLSSWLKDYLYISLGGNRHGKLLMYINLLLTMLLGGLWHGASLRFILWGGIHGLSLVIHKYVMGQFASFRAVTGREMSSRWHRAAGIVFTFHIVCFGWIFFRAPSLEAVVDMLHQIAWHFHPEVLVQFVRGYPAVFALMVAGYLSHFMPQVVDAFLRKALTYSPLILQASILVIVIFIIIQIKSAGVQPFIYFQF